MGALTAILTGDDPAAWEAAGFAVVGETVWIGGVGVECDGSRRGPYALDYAPRAVPAGPPPHPNGATALDHVVLFTESLDRSVAALAPAGWEERRRAEPPAVPLRMAFLRLGGCILEVAERPDGDGERLWGLTVVTADIDATAALLGERLGAVRGAVQPGRRIATLRNPPGLDTAVAFITPR